MYANYVIYFPKTNNVVEFYNLLSRVPINCKIVLEDGPRSIGLHYH